MDDVGVRTAWVALAMAVVPAACGARASLADATAIAASSGGGGGSAGGGGSTTSPGGAGGTTGAGGAGGAAAACTTLTWAGEPVFVPANGGVQRPSLIRTSVAEHALVFALAVPDATLLESAAMTAWWKAWPPPIGTVGVADALGWQTTEPAVGRGEPGSFAFAVADGSELRVRQAAPGNAADALAAWTANASRVKALARANGGAYLVAHGPEGGLVLDVIPAFVPSPKPISTGSLGCTSLPLAADAVGLGDDAFLVASTNRAPFDDCLDPTPAGPPKVVQILRVTTTGFVAHGGYVEEAGPVLDVQLAGRIGGAWLTYRVDGDPTLHIRSIDADGQLGADFSVTGNADYGDAVIALGDSFAHATTFPGAPDAQTPPFVTLVVRNGDDFIQAAGLITTPLRPVGRPALASSNDGRSLLVAFANEPPFGDPPSIGLLRADCAP